MKYNYYLQSIFKSFIIFYLLLLSGCVKPLNTYDQADQNQTDTKTVYIVKDEWHTGVILLKKDANPYIHSFDDFTNHKYIEMGWGDEEYYQAEKRTALMGVKALLLPTNSIIHVNAFNIEPKIYFSNSEVIELKLSKIGFIRLIEFINDSFTLNEKKELIKLGVGFYKTSRFYHANGTFHIFNNCNTWIADAIHSSGFPISRYTFSADSVFDQLKQKKD